MLELNLLFSAAGAYRGESGFIDNLSMITTVLTIAQSPNFQHSMEGLFSRGDGDMFPGVEF